MNLAFAPRLMSPKQKSLRFVVGKGRENIFFSHFFLLFGGLFVSLRQKMNPIANKAKYNKYEKDLITGRSRHDGYNERTGAVLD